MFCSVDNLISANFLLGQLLLRRQYYYHQRSCIITLYCFHIRCQGEPLILFIIWLCYQGTFISGGATLNILLIDPPFVPTNSSWAYFQHFGYFHCIFLAFPPLSWFPQLDAPQSICVGYHGKTFMVRHSRYLIVVLLCIIIVHGRFIDDCCVYIWAIESDLLSFFSWNTANLAIGFGRLVIGLGHLDIVFGRFIHWLRPLYPLASAALSIGFGRFWHWLMSR